MFPMKSRQYNNISSPTDLDSIKIGDYIQVMDSEHMGRHGVVNWYAKGSTNLWFRDISEDERECNDGLSSILVPTAMVQWTNLAQTIQYTKDKGYNVRPGDVVTVVRRPEYQTKGVVHSIDFPNAHLTILSDGDQSLVVVPIKFVTKIRNAPLDSFKNNIGHEVLVLWGDRKGYRATLYSLSSETCTVAVSGQQRTTLKLPDISTRYGMRLNGAMLEGPDLISFCEMRTQSYLAPPPRSTTPPVKMEKVSSSSLVSLTGVGPSTAWSTWSASANTIDVTHDPMSSVNPTTSISDPWTVDAQDSIDAEAKNLPDNGPLPWLMTKEFSLKLLKYHALLKVSLSFLRGKLYKQFVSMACPDPFCGESGPAPEGCIAAFCTSNSAGAALEHYHIPASDLSPAPPRKKNSNSALFWTGIIVSLSEL
ncbi:hypothetical protein DEU56DRAFT_753973 [Suillus clintonianus]|uniref:uncharacterized protein n=1 Tax=Suillus clintonianus TaxID=1904413 RepID=UPI001B8708F7|nr:uncharacterized protein DEU56DRAFT_753973 [Suillus clintonianus]KAG2145920.1 hypothetical protein DEU56DRAFT_753973 [Suillus clintonianus]